MSFTHLFKIGTCVIYIYCRYNRCTNIKTDVFKNIITLNVADLTRSTVT